MFDTIKEKEAFRFGRSSGYRAGKATKSKKAVWKKKPVKKTYSAKNDKFVTDDSARLKGLSMAYAQHMGIKYGLSDSEVRANAKEHYKQAKKDPVFRNDLIEEYGGR